MTTQTSLMSNARTGGPGLDDILAGGFATDRVYLEGAKRGERGLSVTLSETATEAALRGGLAWLDAGRPDRDVRGRAMPGMTGLQLAEAARRLRLELPILLATGYADVPAAGHLDLPRLSKPYQQRQLAEQIASPIG
jgi:CheY-like chemotaxis protein